MVRICPLKQWTRIGRTMTLRWLRGNLGPSEKLDSASTYLRDRADKALGKLKAASGSFFDKRLLVREARVASLALPCMLRAKERGENKW